MQSWAQVRREDQYTSRAKKSAGRIVVRLDFVETPLGLARESRVGWR